MNADFRLRVALGLAAVALLAAARPAHAQKANYDTLYQQYLTSARTTPAPTRLWMADLTADPNARRVNDLITVRVLENVTASGAADSTLAKKGSATASLPGKAGDALGKFLPGASDTKFNGTGGTSRTTELTATMTARVVEVLPNGDLSIEGVREIDVNGDRTLVVLTGVVRWIDILPGNVIPSTRIAQFGIRSLSQGLIKDSLSPGWLIRMLNKIF
ncbi:MAG: flagellar basal body L-ring protein FlgH [Vicinamibacterales bacterium]